MRAGGDQKAAAAEALAVDLDRLRIDEAGVALLDGDAPTNQAVIFLVPVRSDDLILLGDERLEIDRQPTVRLGTRIAWVSRIEDQLRCFDEVLGWKAAAVDAGAADRAALES